MKKIAEFEKRKPKLFALCQKHSVNQLFAFGSVTRNDFDVSESDIDLIVDLDIENPVDKGEHLMQFWSELEELFSRKVDLLTTQKIKNPFLSDEIEKTKQLIYDVKLT